MACTIVYKGREFTEGEFSTYVSNNLGEFSQLLPTNIIKNIESNIGFKSTDNKTTIFSTVADGILTNLSAGEISKIEDTYNVTPGTVEFNMGLTKEVTNTIMSNDQNSTLFKKAKGELVKAFSALTQNEIDSLQGLERNLYNIATGQKTTFRTYPEVKANEVALSTDDGWEVVNRETIIEDVIEGTVSMDTPGVPTIVMQEMMYRDKIKDEVIRDVDYEKILSDNQKTDLSKKLLKVLEKLGFSTLKLSDYIETYRQKNGMDPSVNAIADLVNRVVAISKGENIEEHLTEETAHVLTETYRNQDEIREVLPEVENTEEWKDHAETYFKLYQDKGLSGEQLTEKVRREILGKIIANKISELSNSQPTSFLGRLNEIVHKFFGTIRDLITPSVTRQLDSLTSRIAESVLEEGKLEEMYSAEVLENNPFEEFYNASEGVLTSQLSNMVRDARKLLARTKSSGLRSKLDSLATLQAQGALNTVELLKAASYYTDIANSIKKTATSKVNAFEEAAKKGTPPKNFLNDAEAASISILITEVLPHLQTMAAAVENLDASSLPTSMVSQFNRDKAKVKSTVEDLSTEIGKLKGRVEVNNLLSFESMIDEMSQTFNMSEQAEQEVRDYPKNLSIDVNWLHTYFGNLQNAPNPILALLGRVIGEIYHRTDVATKFFQRRFIDKLNELGIKQGQYQQFFNRLIQKDSEGKVTGYLRNVIDWGRFEKAKEQNAIDAYNAANQIHIDMRNAGLPAGTTPYVFTPITDIKQIGQTNETPIVGAFTGEAKKEYNRVVQEWREENLEQPYDISFRKQREDMVEDIKNNGITLGDGTIVNEVPDEVLDLMADWASRRRGIKLPHMKGSMIDYSTMTNSEKEDLDSIKRERLEFKSLVDPFTGEEKEGREREIALGLQAIEQYYINQSQTSPTGARKVTPAFFSALEEQMRLYGPHKALEWFNSNSGITFNDNFWQTIQGLGDSAVERFNKAIASSGLDQDTKDLLEMDTLRMSKLQTAKSQILKQFKSPNSPAEVETHVMSHTAKMRLITIEKELEDLYSRLNSTLKAHTGTTVANPLSTESTANEAFVRDFEVFMNINPTATIMDFLKENSTSSNYESANNFNRLLKTFETTGTISGTRGAQFAVKKALKLRPDASDVEIIHALENYQTLHGNFDQLVTEFAKTKLAGYYKRFAPAGFNDFFNQFKNGAVVDSTGKSHSISDVVRMINEGVSPQFPNDILSFLTLKPEVEWMEDEFKANMNSRFIGHSPNSTVYGGYGQPRFDKFRNEEFITEYNIDEDIYFSTGETKSKGRISTEKQKELNLLEFLVHNRHAHFKQQNVAEMANSYSLPGVRTQSVDKMRSFAKNPLKAGREMIKDYIENSVDKKLYGETYEGETANDPSDINSLVVPVLNVRPLERVEDTSIDLLYSYSVHSHNANLFANRQNAMTRVNRLEAMLLSKDFKGKEAKNSRAYTMFQDFKKAYLFGVQETKKVEINVLGKQVDLTTMFRTFDHALGTINVGLNPAVSVTAGTSATTFSITEALVGQYMNLPSYKKGIAKFIKLQNSFVSESGKVDKSNPLYLFGERFGLFGILQGVENSNENQFLRTAFKDGLGGMAHFMTELATRPIAPSLMFGIMDNTRFITDNNGNKRLMSFEEFREIFPKLTKAEAKTKWNAAEDLSLLNNILVKDGMVDYSDRFKNEVWGGLTGEELSEAQNTMEMDIRNKLAVLVSRVDAKMPLHDKSMASRNAFARFLLRHREWFTINFQNRFKRGHNNLYTGQYEEGHYHTLAKFLSDTIQAINPKNDDSVKEAWENLTPTQKLNMKRVMIDLAIAGVLIAFGSLVVAPWGDDEENKDNWSVQFLAYMYYRLASEQMSSNLMGVPAYTEMLESPFVAMNSIKELMKISNWSFEEVDSGAYEGHSKLFKLAAKNSFLRHYFDLSKGLQQKSDFYRLNNDWTLMGMQKISKKEKEAREQYKKELGDSYSAKSETLLR